VRTKFETLKWFHTQPWEARAIERLQHPESYPGLIEWPEREIILRLIRIPSFEPYSVWVLRRTGGSSWVRRIIWDRLTQPPFQAADGPMTYGTDGVIAETQVERLLDELHHLSLPPFPAPAKIIGLDGVSYGVEFGDHYCSTRLSWWSHYPEEWQPLVDWYDRAITLFEECLPHSTAISA
jgi:hypothetical protein